MWGGPPLGCPFYICFILWVKSFPTSLLPDLFRKEKFHFPKCYAQSLLIMVRGLKLKVKHFVCQQMRFREGENIGFSRNPYFMVVWHFLNPCGLADHMTPVLPDSHFCMYVFTWAICFLKSKHFSRHLLVTCFINNWLQPFQFSPLIGLQRCITYHFMGSILLDFYITPLMPSGKLKDHPSNSMPMREVSQQTNLDGP